jgi:hypothetical protein
MPAKRTREPRACLLCGAAFAALPCKIKLGQAKFCSQACSWAAQHRNRPEAIWERGERTPSGCLEWTGSRHTAGYGYISLGSKPVLVHRVAWELTNGAIPDGLFICHHCDNPPCYEPAHLFLGDSLANGQDMAQKGRTKLQKHPELAPRGEQHPLTTLTDEQVREIRRLRAEGMILKDLGARFGVHLSTIHLIVKGKHWGHVI